MQADAKWCLSCLSVDDGLMLQAIRELSDVRMPWWREHYLSHRVPADDHDPDQGMIAYLFFDTLSDMETALSLLRKAKAHSVSLTCGIKKQSVIASASIGDTKEDLVASMDSIGVNSQAEKIIAEIDVLLNQLRSCVIKVTQ